MSKSTLGSKSSKRQTGVQATRNQTVTSSMAPNTVRGEQAKQMSKLAQNEIEELKESLRYAEFLLVRTRQEKDQVEGELERHDQKIEEVRREVRNKVAENGELEQQLEAVNGQANFAEMAANKVQEMARSKLYQLQSEIAQREDEIKRLSGNIESHESKLTQMHVVNHIDASELKS